MRYPIVLDLETKKTFRDTPQQEKLGISVVGIYDYKDGQLKSFTEDELSLLYPIMENASLIIGFNIDDFDLPVLSAYYPGDINQFQTFDILEYVRKKLGRRLSLNDIVKATLGKAKTGHGLDAINLFREGKLEELKKYCLDDVALTRELFDYGTTEKQIFYLDERGRTTIKVDWNRNLRPKSKSNISLTLPF